MKIMKKRYPLGSIPNQRTAGRYIDGYLYSNLETMAKAIVKDMTFLGVISSSTLEVGTGKSALASQIGEAWSYVMWKKHKIKVPFTSNNIVWRAKELIERSLTLPKYSCIILDEWEDSHYWSELGMTLRQFFRKCRQLNLFMIIIIPNFFQLNIGYAISRSAFFIDVRFEKGFERGRYRFYDFKAKKKLYLMGKKTYNYDVVKADFSGAFNDGYGVPREEYMEAKQRDMEKWETEDQPRKDIIRETLLPVVIGLREKGWSFVDIAKLVGKIPDTVSKWFREAGGKK